MNDSSIVAYIDGGSRGNPGPAGFGVRIETATGELIRELHEAVGMATNNVAEYRGLLAALSYLADGRHRRVHVRSDSELLVKQMLGEYKVRHPALQALHLQARGLMTAFDQVTFEHVPRERNAEADRLANLAMDKAAARVSPQPSIERETTETPAPPVSTGVLAIGLDTEDVVRVERLLTQYGERFLHRIFTDGEIAYSQRRRHPAQHLTGRFAAKEAAMKALGTGRARGVLWRDIEVVRTGGPPHIRFHGEAARRFEAIGGRRALVSITHTRSMALAQVLILGS